MPGFVVSTIFALQIVLLLPLLFSILFKSILDIAKD